MHLASLPRNRIPQPGPFWMRAVLLAAERGMQGIQQAPHASVLPAEDRVLWYSAQYRDWDVTNGSIAQEASPTQLSNAATT